MNYLNYVRCFECGLVDTLINDHAISRLLDDIDAIAIVWRNTRVRVAARGSAPREVVHRLIGDRLTAFNEGRD